MDMTKGALPLALWNQLQKPRFPVLLL